MENQQKETHTMSVPMAIIVAGILVAGAIFISNKGVGGGAPNKAAAAEAVVKNINLDAITSSEHILGSPNAKVTLVEYSDTECPFCKAFHPTLQALLDEYGKDGKVAWVYRQFPIAQLHPKAPKEAEATECAGELGGNEAFWSYLNGIIRITPSNNGLDATLLPQIAKDIKIDVTAFNRCFASGKYKDKIDAGVTSAGKAGGRGTPYTVVVLQGKLDKKAQDGIVNELTTKLGELPPELITFDESGSMIAISGAIPYPQMKLIVDTGIAASK